MNEEIMTPETLEATEAAETAETPAEHADAQEDDPAAALDALRATLAAREQELAALADRQTRMTRELAELCREFPSAPISALDEALFKAFESGTPLAAAYALAMHRAADKKTPPPAWSGLDSGAGQELYSPAEVRRMTPREVKQNYARIIESMKRW